jgi:cytochrome c-type biogenesis protein CcmH/NrfG
MLKDPLRAVRITAARELLGVPLSNLPPGDAAAVEQAMQEWRLALLAKADFPETQMMIAGTALVTRNWKAAEGAFREAVHLDPQLVEAWVMIVRILAALGDQPAARAALVDAMAANPADALLANLGAQFNPPVVRQ